VRRSTTSSNGKARFGDCCEEEDPIGEAEQIPGSATRPQDDQQHPVILGRRDECRGEPGISAHSAAPPPKVKPDFVRRSTTSSNGKARFGDCGEEEDPIGEAEQIPACHPTKFFETSRGPRVPLRGPGMTGWASAGPECWSSWDWEANAEQGPGSPHTVRRHPGLTWEGCPGMTSKMSPSPSFRVSIDSCPVCRGRPLGRRCRPLGLR
jgi:hypothetical protein